MLETLFILFTGHLLGDFVFQTDRMVRCKSTIKVLLLHAVVVTIITLLLLGLISWATIIIALVLLTTHVAIDYVKVHWLPDTAKMFLLDQGAHLLVLLVLALLFPTAAARGQWLSQLSPEWGRGYLIIVIFIGGVVLCVLAGGVLIGKIIRDVVGDEKLDVPGLENGGRYIGWLERGLVLLLVLINQPAGIGFLFAAKSILRFGDIKEPAQRKVAEYIIIGTFLSFGWALLTATLLVKALGLWKAA